MGNLIRRLQRLEAHAPSSRTAAGVFPEAAVRRMVLRYWNVGTYGAPTDAAVDATVQSIHVALETDPQASGRFGVLDRAETLVKVLAELTREELVELRESGDE